MKRIEQIKNDAVVKTNIRIFFEKLTIPLLLIISNFLFFLITIIFPTPLRIITASIFFGGSIVFLGVYTIFKKSKDREYL